MARGSDYALAKHIATTLSLTFFQDVIDAGGDPEDSADVWAGEMPLRPTTPIVAVLSGIGGRVDSVGIQEDHILDVRTRGEDYQATYDLALQVSNALHLAQGNLGGILMRVRANNSPVSLGRDEGTRGGLHVFSQTFTVVLKQGENTTP
jgi:hypothetical protein